jgi:hypothetical protein
MINNISVWLRDIFNMPVDNKADQSLELSIPHCELLTITINWKKNILKPNMAKAFSIGVSQVFLHPFMTQSDYKIWLIKVLKVGGVNLNAEDCDVKVINKQSDLKPVINVIPKLIRCIAEYEKQEDIRQSADLLILFGRLRRAISEVKLESLLDEEKQFYNRLLVGFDNEIDRLPQWLVQFEAIKKRTWSEH